MKKIFLTLFIAALTLITTIQVQATEDNKGWALWCDPSHGYWGYTDIYMPYDQIIRYWVNNVVFLTVPGWSNGLGIEAHPLAYSQDPFNTVYYTHLDEGELPFNTSVMASYPDGSCLVTPNTSANNGNRQIVVHPATFDQCVAGATSDDPFNADNYNPGATLRFIEEYGVGLFGGDATKFQATWLAPKVTAFTVPLPPQPPNPPQTVLPLDSYVGMPNATPSPDDGGFYPFMWVRSRSVIKLHMVGYPEDAFSINVPAGTVVPIQFRIQSGPCQSVGRTYERWIAHVYPNGNVSWRDSNSIWQTQVAPLRNFNGTYEALGYTYIFNSPPVGVGIHKFYACIDMHEDNVMNRPLICDRLFINVQ